MLYAPPQGCTPRPARHNGAFKSWTMRFVIIENDQVASEATRSGALPSADVAGLARPDEL
eukprot:5022761-Pleurochrysis_carterae.AAC.1